MGKNRRLKTTSSLSAFSSVIAGTAIALSVQASPYPDAGTLYRELRDDSFRKPDRRIQSTEEPSEPAPAEDDSERVFIADIEIHGNTQLNAEDIQAVLQPYSGQWLNHRDIMACADALMRRYHAEGFFLTRVYVPPQQIVDGRLVLYVYEGYLEENGVSLSNNSTRVSDQPIHSIINSNLHTGTAISADEIERTILLLNDLPGLDSHTTIYPGESAGSAHLLIQTEDTPLISGNVDIDNFGSYYTGENRVGTTLYINSPTHRGDQITLRYVTSGSSSNYLFASYSLPLAGNGLRLGISADYLDYTLEREFKSLGAEGSASDLRLYATYPLVRSRHLNLISRLDLSQLTLDDGNDVGLQADRTIDTAILSLSGDHDDHLLANGVTYFSLALTAGNTTIDGDDAFRAFDSSSADTDGRFETLSLSVSRLQHLLGDLSTYLALSGQVASRNLDSSQKFFIGGPFSVPGYPTGEASGDEGWLAWWDLRYDLYPMAWGGDLQLSAFYSHGEVKLFEDPWPGWEGGNPIIENRIALASWGLGLTQSWNQGLVLRGMLGRQVGDNDGRNPITNRDSDNSSSDYRAWFQAIYYF